MATRIWIFLINTFFVNTQDSIKKALSFTVDHLAKLTANMADPDIAAIRTPFLPIHTAFLVAYNQLQSKLGLYHGKTQTLEEMLLDLAGVKINEWRGQVFAIYPEGTPNANAIFPNGRDPFNSGTYEQRIEAVETLSVTLATFTGDPTLIALGLAVEAYYLNLSGARALQQNDEGTVETLRSNLQASHEVLCNWLYKNLGLLMAKYFANPARVADYYDLSLIRSNGSNETFIQEGTAAVGVSVVFPDANGTSGDVSADTEIKLTNKGTTGALTFYIADTSGSLPGVLFATVNAGETRTVTLGSLGFPGDFMLVQNLGVDAIDYKIEIL